jgi:HSP20 family protein
MAQDYIRFMQPFFLPAAQSSAGATAWQPSADVYQTRDGWLVKLDLAGVRPEEVQLSASGNRLIVRGVRRDWCLEEGCCHYQMEIAYSRFERSLSLPVDLERADIHAEHRNGMLLVHIRVEADRQ